MPKALINRAAVKKYVLEQAAARRPYLGLTRVSGKALDDIEAGLRAKIISLIEGHPSLGKTFRP
ncbi:MAG: hypothetical protein KAV00_12035 [Phycisphaerae bacterium]|nr:hypothetical protein [Phycisphaerae bacterium]